jgi:hypothetical protein
MARAKAEGESKSAVFTRLFDSRKDLLQVPSLDEILKLYASETGSNITLKERQVAANIKSKLRKKYGLRGRRGRRRRGRRRAMAGAAPVAVAAAPRPGALLALEDAIDDCIYLARKMESARLDDVVRTLRRARNHLILMNGPK